MKKRVEIGSLNKDHLLNILELGCGNGNDAQGFIVSPMFNSYTGVDISEVAFKEHAERAKEFKKKTQVRAMSLQMKISYLNSAIFQRVSLKTTILFTHTLLYIILIQMKLNLSSNLPSPFLSQEKASFALL